MARELALLRVLDLVRARRLPLGRVRAPAPVPDPPRAEGVAEAAQPLGFQLRAPVTVVQRLDGLTLRGGEGEIHVSAEALSAPPTGWLEAARDGVSVLQAPAGGWTLTVFSTASASGNGGNTGSMPPIWSVPTAALRWHRVLPGLLEPLAQPFLGSRMQRVLGRVLVRLLGLPGVVTLLVSWHRRRTRQRA